MQHGTLVSSYQRHYQEVAKSHIHQTNSNIEYFTFHRYDIFFMDDEWYLA